MYEIKEDAQMGGLTALVIGVVTVGIVMVVSMYVMKKMGTSLNDGDVSDVITTIVTGFGDSATFVPLVLTFGLVGVILAILTGLGKSA